MNYGYTLLKTTKIYDEEDVTTFNTNTATPWVDTEVVVPGEGSVRASVFEWEAKWAGLTGGAGASDVRLTAVYGFNRLVSCADSYTAGQTFNVWVPGDPATKPNEYFIENLDSTDGQASMFTVYVISAHGTPRWLMPLPRYVGGYITNPGANWTGGTFSLWAHLYA